MVAAMFSLAWMSSAVLYWVLSRFLARLVERKCYSYNRMPRSYHCSRQSFIQGHGSGNLSLSTVRKKSPSTQRHVQVERPSLGRGGGGGRGGGRDGGGRSHLSLTLLSTNKQVTIAYDAVYCLDWIWADSACSNVGRCLWGTAFVRWLDVVNELHTVHTVRCELDPQQGLMEVTRFFVGRCKLLLSSSPPSKLMIIEWNGSRKRIGIRTMIVTNR